MSDRKQQLIAFRRAARDLFKSPVVRSGELFRVRLVVFSNGDGDGMIDSWARLPDEDQLRGLATRVRKFYMENDPYCFPKVWNSFRKAASNSRSHVLVDYLDLLHKQWRATLKGWDYIPFHMSYIDNNLGKARSITPGQAFHCWLYAEVIHETNEDLVRRWDGMQGLRGVENLYRWAGIQCMIAQIGIVGRLLLLVEDYLQTGELPGLIRINQVDGGWQACLDASLPVPGSGCVGGGYPLPREVVDRLIEGEELSDEALWEHAKACLMRMSTEKTETP